VSGPDKDEAALEEQERVQRLLAVAIFLEGLAASRATTDVAFQAGLSRAIVLLRGILGDSAIARVELLRSVRPEGRGEPSQ
jgi:hypothetical protein